MSPLSGRVRERSCTRVDPVVVKQSLFHCVNWNSPSPTRLTEMISARRSIPRFASSSPMRSRACLVSGMS